VAVGSASGRRGVRRFLLDLEGTCRRGTLVRSNSTSTSLNFSTAFDTDTLDPNAKGFNLAGFDGRYVYCAPGNTTMLARFDTTGTFSKASSWATFDTKKATSTATTFDAAVFDGRHMYFASLQTGMVARFDARSPAAMPNLGGSFY
jgi:hypothetical protein